MHYRTIRHTYKPFQSILRMGHATGEQELCLEIHRFGRCDCGMDWHLWVEPALMKAECLRTSLKWGIWRQENNCRHKNISLKSVTFMSAETHALQNNPPHIQTISEHPYNGTCHGRTRIVLGDTQVWKVWLWYGLTLLSWTGTHESQVFADILIMRNLTTGKQL